MRNTSTFLAAALCALVAACGGKSAPASTGPTNTGGDGAGASDTDAILAAIGAMAVPDACNNDDGTANLKAHLDAQRESLGGAAETDTSFDCQPPVDGLRECTWGVFNKPPAAPDPDDPCGGECCSGYQIIFKVDAAGAIDPANVFCNAPG